MQEVTVHTQGFSKNRLKKKQKNMLGQQTGTLNKIKNIKENG